MGFWGSVFGGVGGGDGGGGEGWGEFFSLFLSFSLVSLFRGWGCGEKGRGSGLMGRIGTGLCFSAAGVVEEVA